MNNVITDRMRTIYQFNCGYKENMLEYWTKTFRDLNADFWVGIDLAPSYLKYELGTRPQLMPLRIVCLQIR